MNITRYTTFVAAVVTLIGCPDGGVEPADDTHHRADVLADTQPPQDGSSGQAFCPHPGSETFRGEDIAVCRTLYSSPPYVRPPADFTDGEDRLIYGAIERDRSTDRMGPAFHTRSGETFPIPTETAWLADEAGELGVSPYAYLVYLGRVDASGTVLSAAPVARIEDHAIQGLMGGLILEGNTTRRVVVDGERQFEFPEGTAPMRVVFDAEPEEAPASDTAPFQRVRLWGTIENATTAVLGHDGTCLPALSDLGEANPLHGLQEPVDRIWIGRHPAMHFSFDDVFTWDWPEGIGANNMGLGLYISVGHLLRDAPLPITGADSTPHGVPWLGPSTDLPIVTGGGGPCP